MNLSKDDIIAFCDRHPDIARTPENFMIAYEWVCVRDLQPTASNLDLAYKANQGRFEPAPPSESEQARMGSDEFLRAVVLPELRKHSSPPQEDKHPFVRGRRGDPANRTFSDEEIENFTAKEYREYVLWNQARERRMISEEEFLRFIFECIEEGGEAEWPLYIPRSRIVSLQQTEPETSQQESPLEIAAPPLSGKINQ